MGFLSLETKDYKQIQIPDGFLSKSGEPCPFLAKNHSLRWCGEYAPSSSPEAQREVGGPCIGTHLGQLPAPLSIRCWGPGVGGIPVTDVISAGVVDSDNDEDVLEVGADVLGGER